MKPNPFDALIHSRKFILALGDALFSTITTILTLCFAPAVVDKILAVLAIWQPVLIIVIGAIAYEDGATIKADAATAVAALPEPQVEVAQVKK